MKPPLASSSEIAAVCNRALELCGPGYRFMTEPSLLPHSGRFILWDVLGPDGMIALCEEWPDGLTADEMSHLLATVIQQARLFPK